MLEAVFEILIQNYSTEMFNLSVIFLRLAQDKFGWTKNKTDDILLPVMKKLTEKQVYSNFYLE